MTPKMRSSTDSAKPGRVEAGCDDAGCDESGCAEDDCKEDCAESGCNAGAWARTYVTENEETVRTAAMFARRASLIQNFNHPPPGVPAATHGISDRCLYA